MSHELTIFLSSMLPVTELRLSLPIALAVYNMPVWSAFLFAFLGNIVPIVFIIWFLDLFVNKFLTHRFLFFKKMLNWLFEKTRKKHSRKFDRWRNLALIILVAIPLPGTGVWTGTLAAFVFGIPIKKAFPLISLGALIAGTIVTVITLGIISL